MAARRGRATGAEPAGPVASVVGGTPDRADPPHPLGSADSLGSPDSLGSCDSPCSPDGVPWLASDELGSWLALVRLAILLPATIERRLQSVAGLSHVEYFVLARLSEAPGGALRMSGLAAGTDSSVARMTQVVGRLEGRGLVERRPGRVDRRVVEAVLTDAGRDLLVGTAPDHVRHVRSLVVDALDPRELDRLGTTCRRILDRIAEDDHRP